MDDILEPNKFLDIFFALFSYDAVFNILLGDDLYDLLHLTL